MMFRRRHGFTLIELLLGMAFVFGSLILFVPRTHCTKEKGYKTQAISDLLSLRTAQETFRADSGRYATLRELDGRFQSTTGVGAPRIVILGSSWSATVTHSQIPGLRCTVVGTWNPRFPVAGDGEPRCAQ